MNCVLLNHRCYLPRLTLTLIPKDSAHCLLRCVCILFISMGSWASSLAACGAEGVGRDTIDAKNILLVMLCCFIEAVSDSYHPFKKGKPHFTLGFFSPGTCVISVFQTHLSVQLLSHSPSFSLDLGFLT